MPETSDTELNMCAETGRAFSTAEEARASEERFRQIQAECDAGGVPELRKGDVIYVDTSLYLHHGCDDFRGGLAEVLEVKPYFGDTTPYVCVAQEPDTWHNWKGLSQQQKNLRPGVWDEMVASRSGLAAGIQR